jgi:O-antigen ligase
VARIRSLGFGPELLPGALAVAVFIVWAGWGGGFDPTDWYPGAIWLLGLLAAVGVYAWRAALPVPTATWVALACALAFAIWTLFSISWSDARGDAWDGANQTLMYVTVFAIFALLPWRSASATALLGVYSVAVTAVGAITLLSIAASSDPSLEFVWGRLVEPLGYHNANAALYLAAAFPALFVCSRRESPWPLRGLLAGCAAVLIEIALLSQSRGSAIAVALTFLLYLAVVPNRARTLVAAAIIAIPVILAAPTLLDVYTVLRDGGDASSVLEDARRAVILSFIGLVVVGTVIAFTDFRLRVQPRAARTGRIVVNAGGAVAAVAAIVIALVAIGNPVDWAEDRWDDFKSGQVEEPPSASHLTSGLGSNRYDFYRVALDDWADHPVAGIGIRQFAASYLLERRSSEEPAYTHSLTMQILAETGLVGVLLFAGFLVAAVIAAVMARRRARSEFAVAAIGVALAGVGYWLIHGQVDWLWAFPALSAPAFAWLGLAGRIEDPGPEPDHEPVPDQWGPEAATETDPPSRRRPLSIAIAAAIGAAILAAAASYVLPWGAARDIEQASASWGANPRVAYERLDRAADLDFLSERPALTEGAIAVRLDDLGRARDAFAAAVERNPDNWYAQFELGAVTALTGSRTDALVHLRIATRLNPRETLIDDVRRGARYRKPVSMAEIDGRIVDQVCGRFGRTTETRFCK